MKRKLALKFRGRVSSGGSDGGEWWFWGRRRLVFGGGLVVFGGGFGDAGGVEFGKPSIWDHF